MVNALNGHCERLRKGEHGMLHSVRSPYYNSGLEVSPCSCPGQVRRSGKVTGSQFFRLSPLWDGRDGHNAGKGYGLDTSD